MHLINNIHFALLNNYSLSQVPVSITFVFIFREIKCLSLVWAQLCLMFLLSFGGQASVWYTYFTYHMGVQKKKLWIFLLLKNMYVKMFMFSVYHQSSPRQVLSWHVYFIIKHSFKQNLCLDFFTQWFKNKVEVKCVLECMFNECMSFFFSSSDCLLLVSIIQTIQLIIYHEKHRHGTKFQF